MTDAIAGLYPWEVDTWLGLPAGDDLPDWLLDVRTKLADALAEYHAAVRGVVNVGERVDSEARAWRRQVRDALANGRPAPEREHSSEVDQAQVEIATEDSEHARRELASTCIEVLATLRENIVDFGPYWEGASSELRFALDRGPFGIEEAERLRKERLSAQVAELAVPDVDDPENTALTQLGKQELITNGTA
jgi:hypothetical protein